MDDQRREELARLLEQLGTAIHAAASGSVEVRHCLDELRAAGWDAALFLDAVMARRSDAGSPITAGVPIHVGPPRSTTEYRLDAADARWLESLGISPTRHRSLPRRPLPPLADDPVGPASDG